jgi:hypothetical protein
MCIDPLYYNPDWQGYVTFDNPIKVGYPEDTGIAWIPFQLDDIKFLWMYGMDDPSRRLDIVVIVLPENADIQVTPFSRLATAGLLDDLSAHGGLQNVEFTSVGYGIQADWEKGKPFLRLDDWRNYSLAPFQAMTPEWFDLNTNVYATGGGGACYFDAGGPAFLSVDGEDVLVGVAARIDRLCRANAGYLRLDTPWSQVLLRHFVPLP